MTGPVLAWTGIGWVLWAAAWLGDHPAMLFVILWCVACATVGLIAVLLGTRRSPEDAQADRAERRSPSYAPRHRAPAPAAASPPWQRLWAWVRSRRPMDGLGARETAGGESRASGPAVLRPQGWPGTTPPADLGTAAGPYDFLPVTTATCPAGHDPVKVDRPSPDTRPTPAHSPNWANRQPWDTVTLEPVTADRAMAGA
ncbi:MAG TPA: hypothetical protein VGS19_29030 [Streptosporangiaceae bacterium]|nr:hypothetical protein [Streptosporangiaceae bacterium]